MDSEADDGPDGGPGGPGGEAAPEVAEAPDETEVERLRRENRRLEAQLEQERQRRADLIDRYESLLPDGSDTDGDGRVRGDREVVVGEAGRTDGTDASGDGAGGGAASALGEAVRRGVVWGRRRLRALRSRR